MPGAWVKQTWKYNPLLDAPPRYRRACRYDAFRPDPLAELELRLPVALAGIVSDAEHAIRGLNETDALALAPLARLLLRTESIASSKIEGMHVGVRAMARAEAQAETRISPSATALELLDNTRWSSPWARPPTSSISRWTTSSPFTSG